MIIINLKNRLDKKEFKSVVDFELEYLLKFKKNTKPQDKLQELKNNTSDINEKKIVTYLIRNFDSIIIEKPNKLKKIIDHFKTQKWEEIIYKSSKTTDFGTKLLECFGYKDRFRDGKTRGIWLAEKINLKSCCYCNAQYGITIKGKKALFQFDHFFPKTKYPYLSISLYNLIPSCANCNNTKNRTDLNLEEYFHPYFNNLSDLAKFHLEYDPDPRKIFTFKELKKQNLKVNFIAKAVDTFDIVSKHNELYSIEDIYNCHHDIADEILMKSIIYTQKLIKNHLKIDGLFPDKKTYLRYLFSNYINESEIHNRPLSKFTQDLLKQFKIIDSY
ncbi:HNH endonuclease [Chryseobacterium limigenitum]|uniref:HNH endonuclease n=1 Tax=Chryseobacterium limigenitum TaxID=1612149 RepID=A0A1K2IUW3_9FLAO|nr:hypothetical protein [Chryseobacterium limigenitum]SFZ96094.1 hypothetical protein SAMN05216324_1163 [Chryseobacterium limigenitum]